MYVVDLVNIDLIYGGDTRLCESNTALRPIAAKISAKICTSACASFT